MLLDWVEGSGSPLLAGVGQTRLVSSRKNPGLLLIMPSSLQNHSGQRDWSVFVPYPRCGFYQFPSLPRSLLGFSVTWR